MARSKSAITSGTRSRSLCACSDSRREALSPNRASSWPVWRVSSQQTTSASCSLAAARGKVADVADGGGDDDELAGAASPRPAHQKPSPSPRHAGATAPSPELGVSVVNL